MRVVLGLGLVLVSGCGKTEDPSPKETGQTDTEVEEETTVVTGCVRGQLRDFKNAAYANAAVRAVELDFCQVLDEDSSFGDGSFCLENLPVLQNSELQVSFSERCTWAHALQVQPVAKGACNQPSSCTELETWFECEGNSISCQ